MLGHVPFRIRPWNEPAARPTAQPAMPAPTVPVGSTVPVAPLATRALAADPVGVRVVPLRPASPWPARRARDRVLNPFRAFPFRTMHLSRLMYADDD